MNRLEAMSTLLAVVDAGSLSAASRQMRVPLATVSRRVSDLEAHLGAKLLVRTSRRVELTETGRNYALSARDILDAVNEAERAATGEFAAPRGTICVTAPIVFGRMHLLPVISEFLMTHPEINIRLLLSDRVVNFLEDQVDVALRIGALPDSAMVATRVGSVSRVVCASPAYLKDHGKMPKQPADLKDHTCITFEGLMSPTQWVFGEGKARVHVPVRSRLVVNTAEAAIDAACASVGITRVLSYQVDAALSGRKLVRLLSDFEPPPVPVSLVHSGQGVLALKTRAFLEFATDRLRAKLSGRLTREH